MNEYYGSETLCLLCISEANAMCRHCRRRRRVCVCCVIASLALALDRTMSHFESSLFRHVAVVHDKNQRRGKCDNIVWATNDELENLLKKANDHRRRDTRKREKANSPNSKIEIIIINLESNVLFGRLDDAIRHPFTAYTH